MRPSILVAASLLALGAAAQGVSPNYPAEVRKSVAALDQECRGYGGKPAASPDLVKSADLNDDGLADYVVYIGAYNCDGAASAMEAGQSGAAVQVLAGGPGNTAVKAFDGVVYGAAIDSAGPKPRLFLDLGGLECGQKNAARLPFSDWKFCSRPLVWNAAKRVFDYAPLSQVRAVQ